MPSSQQGHKCDTQNMCGLTVIHVNGTKVYKHIVRKGIKMKYGVRGSRSSSGEGMARRDSERHAWGLMSFSLYVAP
jgi:hypothetical protein